MPDPTPIQLACGEARAEISPLGAEPLSWRVGGRQLLWHGDPEHWSFRAPILFPVVGASKGGEVAVGGRTYPMPQHGFARRALFEVLGTEPGRALFLLRESAETLAHYPFPFRLEVEATLGEAELGLTFTVSNPGPEPMPYGLGFHPAFPWAFDAPDRKGHRVLFEAEEKAEAPEVAAGGLLARSGRPIPLEGRTLPLAPDLFTEALVFLEAKSRSFAFESPTGASITMETEGFPHLAVWSRPTAPFLSLEAWTAHADWEDARGDLLHRPSMVLVPPGESRHHAIRLRWRAA